MWTIVFRRPLKYLVVRWLWLWVWQWLLFYFLLFFFLLFLFGSTSKKNINSFQLIDYVVRTCRSVVCVYWLYLSIYSTTFDAVAVRHWICLNEWIDHNTLNRRANTHTVPSLFFPVIHFVRPKNLFEQNGRAHAHIPMSFSLRFSVPFRVHIPYPSSFMNSGQCWWGVRANKHCISFPINDFDLIEWWRCESPMNFRLIRYTQIHDAMRRIDLAEDYWTVDVVIVRKHHSSCNSDPFRDHRRSIEMNLKIIINDWAKDARAWVRHTWSCAVVSLFPYFFQLFVCIASCVS